MICSSRLPLDRWPPKWGSTFILRTLHKPMKNVEINRMGKPGILVLLYGDFDYDGRVQRLVRVLVPLGEVVVLDAAVAPIRDGGWPCRRERVQLAHGWGKVRRHLAFWAASRQMALKLRPAMVVAADYFAVFPGRLVSVASDALLVYDAHELIIPESGQFLSTHNRLWYWLERLGIQRASGVIAANIFRAKAMQEHYRLTKTPLVFRNISVPQVGNLSRQATDRLPIAHSGEIRVIYQGDMSLRRGIRRFIEAVAYLPSFIRLVLAGGGPDLERIRACVVELSLEDRVFCLGRIPNVELPAITQECHVGIVTYPYEGLNNRYCAPNKIFEYAQAGLPVVATDQPPLRLMIEDYVIGILVRQQDDPKAVAETILRVVEGLDTYRQNLKRFLDDHKWKDEADRLQCAIQDILVSGKIE